MKRLHGTGVALVTPLDSFGKIDYPALKKVLKHTAKGVDYYVVMGTTGESATMKKEEKHGVLNFVLKNNPSRLPVVYGIGGNNTSSVLDEIASSQFDGITAVLSVSPYYNKPSQEGIIRHFSLVADACPVPVILYNVPGRTSSNLSADTIIQLAQHRNIIGVKEASGNLEQCMKIARDKPSDFMLISGDDLLTVPIYALGGVGVISVLANAYPAVFRKMTSAAATGNYAAARKELFKIIDINGPMYEEGNPVGVKELMSQMGICGPDVRLPLMQASDRLKARIASISKETKKGQR
ncbi:MAG: 4-hydroxy-tetrahydrodipicolinate synthase [Bacteroidetes bacterium]|nr:4-hydroxy-tetrahydrodipicolinate synthase [Bacteroidota bacterium]